MTKNIYLPAGLVAGALLSVLLSGCVTDGSNQSGRYRSYHPRPVQTTVVFEDDYDYYPGYEVYYSRNRHEYVYRDGNTWVRRPEPQGITASILLATPSVRVDFHDSPEKHHNTVIRSYPKNWKQADRAHGNKSDRHDDNRNDKQNDDRKDDSRRN